MHKSGNTTAATNLGMIRKGRSCVCVAVSANRQWANRAHQIPFAANCLPSLLFNNNRNKFYVPFWQNCFRVLQIAGADVSGTTSALFLPKE